MIEIARAKQVKQRAPVTESAGGGGGGAKASKLQGATELDRQGRGTHLQATRFPEAKAASAFWLQNFRV